MRHDQDDASRCPVGDVSAIPAPPSTLTDLGTWIGAARELLRGQEDQLIGDSGVVHLPVASNDPDEPSHKPFRLHRPSLAYTLREQFLQHLERLYPEDWPHLSLKFQPDRCRTVRDLVTRMFLVEQRISGGTPDELTAEALADKQPEAPAPAGGDQGVSLYEVAFLIEQDDKAAGNLVKRWSDSKKIRAKRIGKCPLDGRRSLYRLSEILEDAKDFLTLDASEISKYRQALTAKVRAPEET